MSKSKNKVRADQTAKLYKWQASALLKELETKKPTRKEFKKVKKPYLDKIKKERNEVYAAQAESVMDLMQESMYPSLSKRFARFVKQQLKRVRGK